MLYRDFVAAFRLALTTIDTPHYADLNTQNYLVYTNSVLFIRSGGNSRVAGVMLAIATIGIWMVGPVIIGYIPVMVVGSLIFYLGMELLREALYDTWGKVHRLEYLTVSRMRDSLNRSQPDLMR